MDHIDSLPRDYYFVRAAIPKFHNPEGLNDRYALPHSSGGQKSRIQVLTRQVSSKDSEGGHFPCMSPSLCRLLTILGSTWLGDASPSLCLCIHLVHFLGVSVYVSKCSLFKQGRSHIEFGVFPTTVSCQHTNHIKTTLFPNKVMFCCTEGQEFNLRILEDTIQPFMVEKCWWLCNRGGSWSELSFRKYDLSVVCESASEGLQPYSPTLPYIHTHTYIVTKQFPSQTHHTFSPLFPH